MIEVMFTCHECKLEKVKVKVRARESREVDVVQYMHQVRGEVEVMHRARSPLCSSKIVDMYIPIPEGQQDGFIGQEVSDDRTETR